MPVALHIFEPRYQEMIRMCIDQRRTFGIVLIKHGREAKGPLADPHDIGCTARVVRVENLGGGRLNILAVGEERFRILELNRKLEYLRGEVDIQPMTASDRDELDQAGAALSPWVQRYLRVLREADLISHELKTLPADPIELANLGAFLLQVPPEQKQALLACDDGVQFVKDSHRIFCREVTLLTRLLMNDQPKREEIAILN